MQNGDRMFAFWAVLLVASAFAEDQSPVDGEEGRIVEHVDLKSGARWIGKKSTRFSSDYDLSLMLGAMIPSPEVREMYAVHGNNVDDPITTIPETFDARIKWNNCESTRTIWDQSMCGSCWAVAAASTMSDHYCIQTGRSVVLSETDLLSCCPECGLGCRGGSLFGPWLYWNQTGIVTGGGQNCTGCLCYPFPRCNHASSNGSYPKCRGLIFHTPKCTRMCQEIYNETFEQDKIYGNRGYFVEANQDSIRREIMLNGPVESGFRVYEDFGEYASGVYFHSHGRYVGNHAIRILGWGVEHNTSYWLIANSWNEEWGEGGTFRMLRGRNECGIEQFVISNSLDY
ncbi:unnamed protein product [Calicophoron daubneyi]|uniref:Peptidase C1A papain C-terminal domain-containing protein n=1 Tax=Calicophoron daubneyi TaxID=300641 RepID=A0AAV2TVJ3_CALDB